LVWYAVALSPLGAFVEFVEHQLADDVVVQTPIGGLPPSAHKRPAGQLEGMQRHADFRG
jgi:hypothetical protein